MSRKRHPPVGARPGTLAIAADAVAPRLTAIQYTSEKITTRADIGPAEVERLNARNGNLWLDVQGLGDADVLRELARIFGIHRLALADVVNAPQRPKTETYDNHEMYISRMVKLGSAQRVEIEQVTIFIGRDYVLTFQERPGDVFDPVRKRLHDGLGPMRRSGPDYLAYALIDTIVDHFYPATEAVGDTLDALEERVLERADAETLGAINRMKRTLLDLRRGIWPQRDAINALVRGDSPFVSESVQVYMRDCYDHAVQITEVIETCREIAGGLFNTYLSVVSNKTNDVMKVLTIMASVFIPLTFMAGIYGMNFESMPELSLPWAYPALLVAMLLVTMGMVAYFYRKGWIGRHEGNGD